MTTSRSYDAVPGRAEAPNTAGYPVLRNPQNTGWPSVENDLPPVRDPNYCVDGCGESFSRLPVIDSENGQAYCSASCSDEASERYWTAVWSA